MTLKNITENNKQPHSLSDLLTSSYSAYLQVSSSLFLKHTLMDPTVSLDAISVLIMTDYLQVLWPVNLVFYLWLDTISVLIMTASLMTYDLPISIISVNFHLGGNAMCFALCS